MRGPKGSAACPNGPEAIAARVQAGQVRWTGVLVVSFARLLLAVLAQAITAGALSGTGEERPFEAAARWFTVHGTLVDLGTLAILVVLLRREGLTVVDLFRARRGTSLGRSLLQVPVVLVLLGSAGFGAAVVSSPAP